MLYKKKELLLIIFFVINIQILLFFNNNQKTNFKYFIWNIQEVSIGKLISISFVSGLFISSLLNKTLFSSYKSKNIIDNDKKKENSEEKNSEIDNNTEFEMPPQRDIRDTQPTISVNYRVIKNNGNNTDYDISPSDKTKYSEDWDEDDKEW